MIIEKEAIKPADPSARHAAYVVERSENEVIIDLELMAHDLVAFAKIQGLQKFEFLLYMAAIFEHTEIAATKDH